MQAASDCGSPSSRRSWGGTSASRIGSAIPTVCRAVIRRNSDHEVAVDLRAQPNKGVRRARHRGDAVFEWHARLNVEQEDVAMHNLNLQDQTLHYHQRDNPRSAATTAAAL